MAVSWTGFAARARMPPESVPCRRRVKGRGRTGGSQAASPPGLPATPPREGLLAAPGVSEQASASKIGSSSSLSIVGRTQHLVAESITSSDGVQKVGARASDHTRSARPSEAPALGPELDPLPYIEYVESRIEAGVGPVANATAAYSLHPGAGASQGSRECLGHLRKGTPRIVNL